VTSPRSPVPPATGLLSVGIATTGSDLDPDGYSLTIAGPAYQERSIGTNETKSLSLPVGAYSLTLDSVRFNCQVRSANPQHVEVAVAATPPVQFTIGCADRPVARVDIEPRPTSLGVGESLQLQATPLDAEVSALPLTGRSVTWASSSEAQATVSSTGLVLGVAHGPMTITATSEEVSRSLPLSIGDPAAAVTVSPASVALGGLTCYATLSAVLLDTQGQQIAGRQVNWTTSDPAIALVSPLFASAAAFAIAVHTGTATVTASTGLQSGSATVTVTSAPDRATPFTKGSWCSKSRGCCRDVTAQDPCSCGSARAPTRRTHPMSEAAITRQGALRPWSRTLSRTRSLPGLTPIAAYFTGMFGPCRRQRQGTAG
jgi:hypothetical protein